jgi:hypothetical protein
MTLSTEHQKYHDFNFKHGAWYLESRFDKLIVDFISYFSFESHSQTIYGKVVT